MRSSPPEVAITPGPLQPVLLGGYLRGIFQLNWYQLYPFVCECLEFSLCVPFGLRELPEASSTSVLTLSASLAFLGLFPVHLCPQLSGKPDS